MIELLLTLGIKYDEQFPLTLIHYFCIEINYNNQVNRNQQLFFIETNLDEKKNEWGIVTCSDAMPRSEGEKVKY